MEEEPREVSSELRDRYDDRAKGDPENEGDREFEIKGVMEVDIEGGGTFISGR